MLVRRERDPDNWRGYRLYLTPKGDIFVNLLDNYNRAPIKDLGVFKQAQTQMEDYDNSNDSEDMG
mgnify:CR=1 FL=1